MASLKYCLSVCTIIFCLMVFLEGASIKPAASKVSSILKNIPEHELREFLRYHIVRGHEALKRKQSQNYPAFHEDLTVEESILLYEYYVTNNLITNETVVKELQNTICWGNYCIDISDPGVHP